MTEPSGSSPATNAPDVAPIVVGFWRRFLADLSDAIVLGALGWGIAYPLRYPLSEIGARAVWFGFAISLVYAGMLQTGFGRGQTLGKRVLGIQVLRRDGGYLGLGASLGRYAVVSFVFYNRMYGSLFATSSNYVVTAAGTLFLLVVFWCFLACFALIPLHPLKRGLHDIVSGSIVVYKGRYDAQKLAEIEDPRRARRVMALLGVLAVLVLGVATFGIKRAVADIDMNRLRALQQQLAKNYPSVFVRESTFNHRRRTLNIEIWLPLRLLENTFERERLRAQIIAQARATVPKIDDYDEVRVWFASGFQLGIANMRRTN